MFTVGTSPKAVTTFVDTLPANLACWKASCYAAVALSDISMEISL